MSTMRHGAAYRSGPIKSQRLALAALATTAGATVVAILRQRAERRDVMAGTRPHASAAATVPLRHRHGRVALRLANWQPERPRSPVGRALATIWACPLTAVGMAIAASTGRRPQWDTARGCFIATNVAGASRWVHRLIGADANTIGQVVLVSHPAPSSILLDHEATHARQVERLGILILPIYAWLGARYGYADHPLEIAARTSARRQTNLTQGE